MPRPSNRPPGDDEKRLDSAASPSPPPADGKADTTAKRHGAALPGSQNADLKGAKRDRTLRGATT